MRERQVAMAPVVLGRAEGGMNMMGMPRHGVKNHLKCRRDVDVGRWTMLAAARPSGAFSNTSCLPSAGQSF